MYKKELVNNLLESYNGSVPEEKKINIEGVVAKLTEAGAALEMVAKSMRHEEIAEAGVPVTLARAIAGIWREEPKAAEPEAPATPAGAPPVQIGGQTMAVGELALALGNYQALPDKVLISGYHPIQQPAIRSELLKRAGQAAFIVFSDKKTCQVDVEASEANLRQIQLGIPIGDRVSVDGKMVRVYRVGEMPDAAYEICPVHEIHLAGPDQYCALCQRAWKGIPEQMRHLVYMQTQEVWGDVPQTGDARLQQMFLALGNADDQYWDSAKLELESYVATGKVVVLVKPPVPPKTPRR